MRLAQSWGGLLHEPIQKDAWKTYFRAEAASDEACIAFYEARDGGEPAAVLECKFQVAIKAMREAFAAQDVADNLTLGFVTDELQAELEASALETAKARQEAIRVLRKARREAGQ
jgi:hypothetical protein